MTLREQEKQYRKAARAIKGYSNKPNINDIEFGVKMVDGVLTDELCIRFHVKKKTSLKHLKSNEVFPNQIEGFKTDVVDFDYNLEVFSSHPRTRIRPLIGGTQILSQVFEDDDYAFGTMGAVFTIGGTAVGLTNYHVLYGEVPVEVVRRDYAGKSKVYQNVFDQKSNNSIGVASHVFDMQLDYALFSLGVGVNTTQSVNGIEGVIDKIVPFKPLYGDTRVKKSGATTGLSYGIISGRSLLAYPRLLILPDPTLQAPGLPLSFGGDSGSLWIVNDLSGIIKIVGLHYQGNGGTSSGAISFDAILASIKKQTQ